MSVWDIKNIFIVKIKGPIFPSVPHNHNCAENGQQPNYPTPKHLTRHTHNTIWTRSSRDQFVERYTRTKFIPTHRTRVSHV